MKTNNPILKTDKRSEKILQKKIYENTNMKRHPTSLVIQEIQIKTIRRHYYSSSRMTKMKNKQH